jgi:hypothetical protein
MANSKKDNAMMMDPNRFKIAQQMSPVPGGPMNNNPMNVTSIDNQPGALSGVNQFPYGDSGLQDAPQLGANILNPMGVQNSGLPQTAPMGRGLNGAQPYTMQQQPSPAAEEPLEGMRLGQEAMNRGIQSSQFMGPVGSAAMMPGALDPTIPGGSSSLQMMPTTQMVDGGQMVPGSTPQKIQKKKGKK